MSNKLKALPKVPRRIVLKIPQHVVRWNARHSGTIVESVEEQMRLAIGLATENVRTGSGGPFGAIVVEIATNRIICGATNIVVASNQGWAHGEATVAALLQQMLQMFLLPPGKYRLVTSAQMCACCFGLSFGWRFAEIVASARGSDVERLTPFKEGRLPRNWRQWLRDVGTEYRSDVLRREGLVPLEMYGQGGTNYFDAGKQTRGRNSRSRAASRGQRAHACC